MQNTQTHPYSVTGVKSFRGREGYGFNATLHRDGRKIAFVIDQADGGIFRYEWLAKDAETRRADEQALADYCAAQPPVDCDGFMLTVDADVFLGMLVEEVENARRLTRAMKKRVLFVEAGQLRQSMAAPTAALIAAIRAKHPKAQILNDLPQRQAVALFTQYAGA